MTTTEHQGADDLTALTAAVVKRMDGLFKPFPTWDRDALMSEGMDLARKAASTFDPTKGAGLSTWVSVVVWRGLKTIHRTAEREASRDRTHGAALAYSREGRAFDDVDETLPVLDWVGSIYRQATHTVGRISSNRGGSCLEPAQEAAVVALKNRLNLSGRGLIDLLLEQPLICKTIQLKQLPSYRKIYRMCDRLKAQTANNEQMKRSAKTAMKSRYLCEADAARTMAVSAPTLRRWRRDGECPVKVYRPRGLIRYLRKDVEDWMEAQGTAPAETPVRPAGEETN